MNTNSPRGFGQDSCGARPAGGAFITGSGRGVILAPEPAVSRGFTALASPAPVIVRVAGAADIQDL